MPELPEWKYQTIIKPVIEHPQMHIAPEGNCEFLTSGKDHLKTMSVTLACVEASETGERVVMEDFYKRSGIPSKRP